MKLSLSLSSHSRMSKEKLPLGSANRLPTIRPNLIRPEHTVRECVRYVCLPWRPSDAIVSMSKILWIFMIYSPSLAKRTSGMKVYPSGRKIRQCIFADRCSA
jgi:hypothetical protein